MTYEPPTIYGIIGYPLTHSLSPLMHNAAFKALDVNAVYKTFPLVDDEELKLFMEDLKEENNPIFGINVTVPYKEKVLSYLDSIDPLAEKIGAVNTIIIDHRRKMHGFNTDAPGFLSHLHELSFDPKGKRIIVLGAGGTARAVISVLSLVPQRPREIIVYNRTKANAQAMLDAVSQKINTDLVKIVDSVKDLDLASADLVINTTSVGLKLGEVPVIGLKGLNSKALVYDVIYNPPQTEFLKQASQQGVKTANGLGMLFYQGVLAFNHWAELEISDEIKKIMRTSLEG